MAARSGRARPPGAGRGSTRIRDRPRTARGPRSAPIDVRRAAVGPRCPVEGGAYPSMSRQFRWRSNSASAGACRSRWSWPDPTWPHAVPWRTGLATLRRGVVRDACPVRMDGTAEARPDRGGSDGSRGHQGPAPHRTPRRAIALPRPPSALRTRFAWVPDQTERQRLASVPDSVAAQVERIVVTSDLDASRCWSSPTSRLSPTPTRGRGGRSGVPAPPAPPVVLFQGSFGYPPNIDGAEWLATAIALAFGRRSRRLRCGSSAVR